MAVYDPALMLQSGTWLDTAYVVVKAIVAVGLWGAAATGFLIAPIGWAGRVFAVIAACLLVTALPITDEIGFALSTVFVAWHFWRARSVAPSPA
jgi:TRAP-type uncharacterized transport system fused permease subunit